MTDRVKYNSCIAPYITGSKTKDKREHDFCIGAKICSGKAKNEEDAEQMCLTIPTKDDKGSKKNKGEKFNPRELSLCILENIGDQPIDLAGLSKAIAICQNAKRPYGKKAYIRDCIKEKAITGSLAETIKSSKQCEREWKENNEPKIIEEG